MKLNDDKLIATVLILQLIAIVGSYLFTWLSKRKGNKFSLIVMIFLWIGICISAYFIETEYYFYLLALFIGMVMGEYNLYLARPIPNYFLKTPLIPLRILAFMMLPKNYLLFWEHLRLVF